MDALERTNQRMQNCNVVRKTLSYKGPQCITHRGDEERLRFTPTHRANSGLHRGLQSDNDLDMLQCSSCAKWRRVDTDTLAQFSNEYWLQDRFQESDDAVLKTYPKIISVLKEYIEKHKGTMSVDNYHAFLSEKNIDYSSKDVQRTLLSFLRRLSSSDGGKELTSELYAHYEELFNEVKGVAFTCSMLVDSNCDKACDWEYFTSHRHDLAQAVATDHRDLFVTDAVSGDGEVKVAQQWRHTWVAGCERFPGSGSCSMPECNKSFPAEPDTHAKNG